ncbi:MAG: polysaccharide deacetylase family protein [Lentilitoribacter sp.]
MLALIRNLQSEHDAASLVLAAIQRSASRNQCLEISIDEVNAYECLFCVDPSKDISESLIAWAKRKARKLVIFGALPVELLSELDWKSCDLPQDLTELASSPPTPIYQTRESQANVRYLPNEELSVDPIWSRPFERFDFADEWNNHGYGAIRGNGDIWSINAGVDAGQDAISDFMIGDAIHSSFSALGQIGDTNILWVNRSAGLIDSYEWRIVENFLTNYKSKTHPCFPIIRQIPHGFDMMVTSRLDCDEDVSSARGLWSNYQEWEVPFSVALLTSILASGEHDDFIKAIDRAGGSILSHSVTHTPNWGGSYEAAFQEMQSSAAEIKAIIGRMIEYAVSPFHQNPDYAVRALCDTGYKGFVGGIIANDPEFILARGGTLADLPSGFVSHSQQCMLHGDCLLEGGQPLSSYYHAVDLAFSSHTLFGYLDHPFSQRYQYGWQDEQIRANAHKSLINYIKNKSPNTLFVNEEVVLNFIQLCSAVSITSNSGSWSVKIPSHDLPYKVAVEFKNRIYSFHSDDNCISLN